MIGMVLRRKKQLQLLFSLRNVAKRYNGQVTTANRMDAAQHNVCYKFTIITRVIRNMDDVRFHIHQQMANNAEANAQQFTFEQASHDRRTDLARTPHRTTCVDGCPSQVH